MNEKRDRTNLLLSDIYDNEAMAAAVHIGAVESNKINELIENNDPVLMNMQFVNMIGSAVKVLSSIIHSQSLHDRLSFCPEISDFQMVIGTIVANNDEHIESHVVLE